MCQKVDNKEDLGIQNHLVLQNLSKSRKNQDKFQHSLTPDLHFLDLARHIFSDFYVSQKEH